MIQSYIICINHYTIFSINNKKICMYENIVFFYMERVEYYDVIHLYIHC
jgi:hypothetical protein